MTYKVFGGTLSLTQSINHYITLHYISYRYSLSGRVMPTMREWMQKVIGIDVDHRSPAQVRQHDSLLVFQFLYGQTDTQTHLKQCLFHAAQMHISVMSYRPLVIIYNAK